MYISTVVSWQLREYFLSSVLSSLYSHSTYDAGLFCTPGPRLFSIHRPQETYVGQSFYLIKGASLPAYEIVVFLAPGHL